MTQAFSLHSELRGLALIQPQAAGLTWIEVLQPEAFAFGDAERADVFLYTVKDLFSRDAAASLSWRRNLRSPGRGLKSPRLGYRTGARQYRIVAHVDVADPVFVIRTRC